MDPIIGHEAIQRELASLAVSADPPHALLFVGPDNTGRKVLARHFAMLLNCERAAGGEVARGSMFGEEASATVSLPCGECRSCRLIADDRHPDVVVVGPGDAFCKPRPGDASHAVHPLARDIRICQVRGMIETVARYPFEARYRVIVLDPADRLTRDAANTMLKTLEEPPGHTVFALISAAPEAIIETVVSRCRRVDVRTVAKPVMEAALLARGVDPQVGAAAATAARGRPGLAVAFAQQPDLAGDRDRHLRRCAAMAAARMTERLRYSDDLAKRARTDRPHLNSQLDIWEAFWSDQLHRAAGEPAFGDSAAILGALRAVTQARQDILANVLPRPALDLMLLSFPRLTLSDTLRDETASNA